MTTKTAIKHLKAALTSLSKTKAKKRKKKVRTNPCDEVNPRIHFPKTKRGRSQEMKTWHILRKGKPPMRFKTTKKAAFAKAASLARKGKLVLDGPK